MIIHEPKHLWVYILTHLAAWIGSIVLSIRWYGIGKSIRFFIPTLIAGFALETAGVLTGKYIYPPYPFSLVVRGHNLPMIIVLGWSATLFFLRELAFRLGSKKAPPFRKRILVPAILTAGLGIGWDLILDPLAHRLGWWRWPESSGIAIAGVPLTNFTVWFFFLFYMTVLFQVVEKRDSSESMKLVFALGALPIAGAAMLGSQLIVRTTFTALGWI